MIIYIVYKTDQVGTYDFYDIMTFVVGMYILCTTMIILYEL